MLTYTLDKQAGLSLYEQLYRRVKADILSGRLAAGEKLPANAPWLPILRSASSP